MTSCSPRADLATVACALALASLAAGCKAERVVETQTLVFAESRACMESRDVLGFGMNAYVVRLYEFTPAETPSSMVAPCLDCFATGRCRPARTQCRCGARVPVGTLALNQELANLRFADLDPNKRYCVGLLAFDAPGLMPPPGTPPGPWDCACASPDAGAVAPGPLRLCGLSPFPGSLDENAAAIIVSADCPGPMAPTCPFPVAFE